MGWNEEQTSWYATYYALAVLSIGGAIAVIISIFRLRKSRTTFTNVVFCLHLSLMLDEITTLPYAFNSNSTFCVIIEMIHYYATLMNYFSLAILIQAHMCNVIESFRPYMSFLEKYGIYIICIAPLMVLFRFADTLYESPEYPWCCVHASILDPLYILTYYLWMWLVLCICSIQVATSTYYIYLKTDGYMAWRYFATIGFYMFIAIGQILPTTIITAMYSDADDDGSFSTRVGSFLPEYISGILYTFIFFRDREAIENFEVYHNNANLDNSPSSFSGVEFLHALTTSDRESVMMLNSSLGLKSSSVLERGDEGSTGTAGTTSNPILQTPVK